MRLSGHRIRGREESRPSIWRSARTEGDSARPISIAQTLPTWPAAVPVTFCFKQCPRPSRAQSRVQMPNRSRPRDDLAATAIEANWPMNTVAPKQRRPTFPRSLRGSRRHAPCRIAPAASRTTCSSRTPNSSCSEYSSNTMRREFRETFQSGQTASSGVPAFGLR